MGHEENDHERKKKKRRKEKEPALLGDANVTEEERRELRREQRSLHKRIHDEDDRGDEEDVLEFLERGRQDNNALFKKVTHMREAVLDGNNQELLVSKTKQQMNGLVTVPRFDAVKLAKKIKSKCSTGVGSSKQMDWELLGRECALCFNAIPRGVSFLAGTMEAQVSVVKKKARKPRAKRLDMKNVQEVRPELMDETNNKRDADKLSAAEKTMNQIKKTLRKHSQPEKGRDSKEVDGVSFLFNPQSFTQTVENIFHYSFMVKKGNGAIGVRSKEEANEEEGKLPGLHVKYTKDKNDDDEETASEPTRPNTQAVVSFTMRDFRRICQAHELKKGMLKHRTGSKHAKRTSYSQTQQEE